MACYRLYEWSTTDDPLLRAVPCAVVLTMRGSARIDAPAFRACRRLCAQTWVQENAGWRRCAKPPRVVDSATDLLHAYWHACKAFADDPAPILILEDDALVLNADRAHYEAIDAFVRAADYDVYGLGNGGMFDALALGPHRRVRGVLGYSQAIVWSARARHAYLQLYESLPAARHVDVHMISRFARKYVYHRPLVVQLFPATENQAQWCFRCDGSTVERVLTRAYVGLLHRVLHLDVDPRAWHVIYAGNCHAKRAAALLALAVLWAAACRRARA